MKTITSDKMKQLEQNSSAHGITTLKLMENAGLRAASCIRKKTNVENHYFIVFCGKGGNGGDGFVVASKLFKWGANVIVVLT
ncbi:MAG: NAD(P)H-hydrate epimerase, partial [Oscillospiraceae bacterium]